MVDGDSSSSEEKEEVLIDLDVMKKKRCSMELKKENAMYEGQLRSPRMIIRLLVDVVIIYVLCLLTVLYCKLM